MKEGGSRAVLMFWLLLHSSLAGAKWRGRGRRENEDSSEVFMCPLYAVHAEHFSLDPCLSERSDFECGVSFVVVASLGCSFGPEQEIPLKPRLRKRILGF